MLTSRERDTPVSKCSSRTIRYAITYEQYVGEPTQ